MLLLYSSILFLKKNMKILNNNWKLFAMISGFLLFANQGFAVETKTADYYKKVKGYLAMPEIVKNKQYPTILLVHEWWGLNEDIKEKARAFAKEGYIAFAVDLYNGEVAKKPDKARKLAGEVRNNMEDAFENLKSAFVFLRSLPEVDEKRLASVGWCFGGGWSYQIAKNNLGTKASIIYYGRFNPADDLKKMRANILGHFAEKDRGIKVDNVREFQAKLKTLSGDHEIYIYPNTGHGFANPDNSVYDKQASELANKRTLEFLKKYL